MAKVKVTIQLTDCQANAFTALTQSSDNVFVTGVAGSGKSFLIKQFLRTQSEKTFPILASTGAAAILVGGRTFHSFFGLGIMQGGLEATVQRALANKKLVRRLKKTQGVVIDEVSMLSGMTLRTAETIARKAREQDLPWGGIRVIAVGDFAQLPPVNPFGQSKDWAFLDPSWTKSGFKVAVLKTIMRTQDTHFVDVLNHVREGRVTAEVTAFLNNRKVDPEMMQSLEHFDGTRLFAHRETTEKYNLTRLENLEGKAHVFETIYSGDERYLNEIKKSAPVPERIMIKTDALVMIRQNDPQGRYFNGSLGYVQSIGNELLKIKLLTGSTVDFEKVSFSILNAEGAEVASATNFPINLAYAATIHKAQGLTLDKVYVDLQRLWEPGQAYVALSRVRSPEGLFISDWSPSSIKFDQQVATFNQSIW